MDWTMTDDNWDVLKKKYVPISPCLKREKKINFQQFFEGPPPSCRHTAAVVSPCPRPPPPAPPRPRRRGEGLASVCVWSRSVRRRSRGPAVTPPARPAPAARPAGRPTLSGPPTTRSSGPGHGGRPTLTEGERAVKGELKRRELGHTSGCTHLLHPAVAAAAPAQGQSCRWRALPLWAVPRPCRPLPARAAPGTPHLPWSKKQEMKSTHTGKKTLPVPASELSPLTAEEIWVW